MAEAAQPEVRLRGFLSKSVAFRFSADPASGSAADAYSYPRLAGPVARLAEVTCPIFVICWISNRPAQFGLLDPTGMLL